MRKQENFISRSEFHYLKSRFHTRRQKELELIEVGTVQKKILNNLLELYVYDFTEFMDFDVDDEGLFHYPLDEYLAKLEHRAFLIKFHEKLAGFCLHKITPDEYNHPINSLEEFFILKKYRRQGVGTLAAQQIFAKYPGQWLIFQSQKNYAAQHFWRKVIASCTQGQYYEFYKDGKPFQKFEISSEISLHKTI